MARNKYKKIMIEDFGFAVDKIEEEEDPFRKNYFLSAFYGQIQRILNFEFNASLAFHHSFFADLHGAIGTRLNSMRAGDTAASILPLHFEVLVKLLREYIDRLEEEADTTKVLEKISVLRYSTTGNGYYLMQKGIIDLEKL